MKKEKLLSAHGIQFIAKNPFPYGTEFAFLRPHDERAKVWMVSVISDPRRVEEVKIEAQGLEGRRFVVLGRCEGLHNEYMCAAFPVEKIDERADELEAELLEKLLRSKSDKDCGQNNSESR